MIFSSLNTYIQFVGAIYVTIVFDNIMFRRFWSPDFYATFKQNIERFKLPVTNDLRNWMSSEIETKGYSITGSCRKRGYVMLVCVILMLIGNALFDKEDSILTLPYIIIIIYSYVNLLLVHASVVMKWHWILLMSVIQTIVFMGLIILNPIEINLNVSKEFIRGTILVLISLPIIVQLLLSWYYSSFTHCYIIAEIGKAARDYLKVKEAILQKDENLVPESYKDVLVKMKVKQTGKDAETTQINAHLVAELKEIFTKQSFINTCKAYYKNNSSELATPTTKLIDEHESVNIGFNLDVNGGKTDTELMVYVINYEEMKSPPKIDMYCDQNNIKVTEFKRVRKEYLQNKDDKPNAE